MNDHQNRGCPLDERSNGRVADEKFRFVPPNKQSVDVVETTDGAFKGEPVCD